MVSRSILVSSTMQKAYATNMTKRIRIEYPPVSEAVLSDSPISLTKNANSGLLKTKTKIPAGIKPNSHFFVIFK